MRVHNSAFLAVLFVVFHLSQCLEFMSSELLILPFTSQNFSLSSLGVSYRPSLLNMPDLPSWLHYTYSPAIHSGFIYGTPPEDISDIKLEVIATDKLSYNITRRVFDIHFKKHPMRANEVRFKITNMNIHELIIKSRWENLKSVLVEDLWPESYEDGVMTSLLPAPHKGDNLPLLPDDKEGVYVSFGSSSAFSFALLELEMEVKPLWQHRPCPKYFKKASYERFFRHKGFAVDWCSFKLHTYETNKNPKAPLKHKAALMSLLGYPPLELMKKSEVFVRSYVWDVIHTILIPLMVMLVLLGLLTLAMCCHRINMDLQSSIFFDQIFDDFPRAPTIQEIQMVHYAGVNKALSAIHNVKGIALAREYSPHPSTATTTTQVDTLPRSRTGSPSSTLPRSSATPSRRFEDYATLTRPNPPPYQRNGSIHYKDEEYLDS
ncbi:UNVERIFIED_CONTAM: hypothetical protein RMT77_011927 [Armadillidium vulgare]